MADRLELEPQVVNPHKEILSSFILLFRRDLSYLKSDKSDIKLSIKVTDKYNSSLNKADYLFIIVSLLLAHFLTLFRYPGIFELFNF